jgi:hypothetical protein
MSYDPVHRRMPGGYAQQQWPPDHYQHPLAETDGFDGQQRYDEPWPYAGAGQQAESSWNDPRRNEQAWNEQGWNEQARPEPRWNEPGPFEPRREEPGWGGFDDTGYRPAAYQPGFDGQPYYTGEDGQPYYTGEPDITAQQDSGGGRHQVGRWPGPGLIAGAVMGFLAAGTAIGVATLAAAFFRPQASPIIAVGEAFIDRTPPALKNFAVEKFGENDKTMLLLGMYVTIALLAMAIGVLARKQVMVGVIGVVVFGLFGSFVAYTRPASRPSDVIPSIIGGIAGVIALRWLAHAAEPAVERG